MNGLVRDLQHVIIAHGDLLNAVNRLPTSMPTNTYIQHHTTVQDRVNKYLVKLKRKSKLLGELWALMGSSAPALRLSSAVGSSWYILSCKQMPLR